MKTKVKLGMDKMSVPELLAFSNHAVSKMTSNAFFPTPSPALAKVNSAISALQKAFDAAQGAGPQQTAVVNQSRDLLEIVLTALGHYVEDIANDPVNSTTGADAIILSAGMDLKSVTPRQKQTFHVSLGDMPGSVELTGEHVKRGSHEWQYLPAGVAGTPASSPTSEWIDAEPTVQATTIITGLEAGRRYYFRHRTVTKDGPSAWDEPESVIVS